VDLQSKDLHFAHLNSRIHSMAQTLLEVQRQIEQLRIEEAKLKKIEGVGVIARMKAAIAAYGFTPEDLFGAGAPSAAQAPTTQVSQKTPEPARKSQAKVNTKAKYADGNGNEWVGRGPRPLWLRTEMEAGKPLSDFLIKRRKSRTAPAPLAGTAQPSAAPAVGREKAKTPQGGKPKQKQTIRFRDDKGNAWTGKGWMPLWMKAEIEATGKTKEDFRVQ
jgi:DNA-binding protein H-NS